MYWVGQKVCSGFPVRCCGKIRTNFLANPIPTNGFSAQMMEWLCVCSVSRVQPSGTLWTVACQAPLPMEIFQAGI